MRKAYRNAAVLSAGTIGLVAALSTLPTGAGAATQPPPPGRPDVTAAAGEFQDWNPTTPPKAVAYDRTLVPTGSSASVVAVKAGASTTVVLTVSGLKPNHAYGAHVHAKACGATGADAGPHYQNTPDPVQPSVSPVYANPRNEIWLDFTTDRWGRGFARARVGWTVRAGGANSVVVHEHTTSSDDGMAGSAGARVGCLTAAF